MTKRRLGRSELFIEPLVLGTNVVGWTMDEATSFDVFDAWLDLGMNFIDTADMYSTWVPGHSGGESETIIGRWLAKGGRRNKVVLATKVGKPMGGDKVGLHPKYIRQAVDASLTRLKTDHIDLYQSHDDDASVPVEDVMGAFDDLVKAGKVRAVGASNYAADRFKLALDTSEKLGITRYETLQPLFNLHEREPYEKDLQPLCVERGIGVINFYALASGFLTGKYRSEADAGKSVRGANIVKRYLDPRGLRILAALDAMSARVGATQGQLALAWQMVQPGIAAPIASATTVAQLKELVQAAELKLDAQALAELDQASAY